MIPKTTYEIWSVKRYKTSLMKVLGCDVFVKRLVSNKLEPKSDKCYFVGYHDENKEYHYYNLTENKVFVARTVVFLES